MKYFSLCRFPLSLKAILYKRKRQIKISFAFLCFTILIWSFWSFSRPVLGFTELTPIYDEEMANQSKNATCKLPYMKEPRLFDNSRRNKTFQLDCGKNGSNLVEIKNGRFVILKRYLNCSYKTLNRVNDDKTVLDVISKPFKNGDPIPKDYFKVFCRSTNSSKIEFEMALLGIKPLLQLAKEASQIPLSKNALGYNVALLGFDSISRISFMENLPQAYDILTNTLDGTVFKKHSVVGDGSTINLLAIFTGMFNKEIRTGYRYFVPYMENYPLILFDYKKSGYITAFAEDYPQGGTFQNMLSGFNNIPQIDHYNRPFYLYEPVKSGCLGDIPRHNVLFNQLHELYNVYSPSDRKFSVIYNVDSCHDDNILIQALEDDLVKTLKEFRPGGKFNNTILVVFADHGPRYSAKRSTLQGKYEERLPFLSISLPEKLRNEKPELVKVLRENSEKLTTQFDLHATLRDIIGLPAVHNRSQSLFRPVPHRSCQFVNIGAHWCMCNSRENIAVNNSNVKSAALATVQEINKVTNPYRNKCAELSLKSILSAERLKTNRKILTFNQTIFYSGRYEMTDNMKLDAENYLITFSAVPGDGIFESTVLMNLSTKKMSVNEKEISRINKYSPWVKCIQEKHPEMRKFCICKEALKHN